MKQLDSQVWVSAQIQPEELAGLAQQGFKAIVCNRPDGEEPGQPRFADMEAAASAHGMTAVYLPMTSRDVAPDQAAEFARMLGATDGKVFAYCRSGARCEAIWTAAKARV